MRTKSKTLENQQTAPSMELAAASQCHLHILTTEDWGLNKRAKKMLEDIGDAEEYAGRMIFLGGVLKLKSANVSARAQSQQEMLKADLVDQKDFIGFYSQAVPDAGAANDIGTRGLFERTAMDDEDHMARLDPQVSILRRMGEPAFAAIQIGQTLTA